MAMHSWCHTCRRAGFCPRAEAPFDRLAITLPQCPHRNRTRLASGCGRLGFSLLSLICTPTLLLKTLICIDELVAFLWPDLQQPSRRSRTNLGPIPSYPNIITAESAHRVLTVFSSYEEKKQCSRIPRFRLHPVRPALQPALAPPRVGDQRGERTIRVRSRAQTGKSQA